MKKTGPDFRMALTIYRHGLKMLFNVSKCKTLHVGRQTKGYTYTMNGRTIEVVDCEKDVGVIMHNPLKPYYSVPKQLGRLTLFLVNFSRAVTYRDKDTLVRLYKVYVRPHLEYAVQSCSPWTAADKVQCRAIRMVSNLRGRTYEERLAKLGMVTLETRRLRGDMIQTFRIMSGIDLVDSETWFTPSNHKGC